MSAPARPRKEYRAGAYFISGGGLVKIGSSVDIDGRLHSLRMGCPVPLTLEGAVFSHPNNCRAIEVVLHIAFDEYRRHGEWFSLPGGWMTEAERIAAGWRLDGICNAETAHGDGCRGKVVHSCGGGLFCSAHYRFEPSLTMHRHLRGIRERGILEAAS